MAFNPLQGPERLAHEHRAKQALDELHRVSPHQRAHGQVDMKRARGLYERDNPSRLRFLWRAWDFLFGRGRTRMPR